MDKDEHKNPSGGTMESHDVSYEIIGDDMQLVEIELDPGEIVIAEAGAMSYAEDAIEFEARMGDGTRATEGLLGKFMRAGMRMVSGETLFLTHFKNTGSLPKRVAFAAFSPSLDYNIERAGNLRSMLFGGEGLFLATISGHGSVWLQSLPFARLADRVIRGSAVGGGRRKGEGSILGGLGDLFGDR